MSVDSLEFEDTETGERSRLLKRSISYIPLLGERNGKSHLENNPFSHQTSPITKREIAKRVVVALTLFPFRLVIGILITLFAFLVAKLALSGLPTEKYDSITAPPLTGWRRWLASLICPIFRAVLFCLGFHWISVRGRPASLEEAPITVANHSSGLVDGIIFFSYAKLAETAYLDNPVLRAFVVATECVLVDRTNKESRARAKQALRDRARDHRYRHTMVFPEGTCTNGAVLVQFKVGAFSAGVPVQPVALRYTFKNHDPSFTTPMTNLTYMLGLMLQWYNTLEINYLPVYHPSAAELENPTLYAQGVRETMARFLQVPVTMHAAEDCSLIIAAHEMDLPVETANVGWQLVRKNLAYVTVNQALSVLKNFRDLDTKGTGQIDFDTFATGIQNQPEGVKLSEEELLKIFDLMDTRDRGLIDFAEYFCGVAVLTGYGTEEMASSHKMVFDVMSRGKSHFSKSEFNDLIVKALPTSTTDRLREFFEDADRDRDGLVNRDEFIQFAIRHDDVAMDLNRLLVGGPLMQLS
uniref:EF-hand domain-containing protein n=1 Tax=Noctiluca scintillans TaxID=2966 RepID=A0A7S1FHM0_NOCSC|eukprot:CAMPEP_0194539098 /NCGR_PEP_ID=MMETSP0253-20130528/78934_1 /TAXON_ID=2966 /ORGANISM="Noctiluca scintillans" /LENGTH=524 /DNA_ID=CAMNT_0039385315 /DNA_START=10 /DNA_END=1584 /DNA_ORIENTATION=+